MDKSHYLWDYKNCIWFWKDEAYFVHQCSSENEAIIICKELNKKLKSGMESPHLTVNMKSIQSDAENSHHLEKKIEEEEKLKENTGWL